MDRLILERVRGLPDKEKKEVLDFIEFIKIREDQSFVDYVNRRAKDAMEARKRGEKFTSLQELQKEYA